MHRSFVYLGSSLTSHFPLTVNIIRAWDYPKNRRVSGQRLCLLILQISISADRDVPAFFESGDIFPFLILKKRQRNVRCVQKLPCSTEQKLELVDAAVKHLKAQQ